MPHLTMVWSIYASLNHSLSNWGNEIQNIKQCRGSDLNQQRQGNCKLSFLLCPWFTLFCSATALFPDPSSFPMPRATGHRKHHGLNIGGIPSYPCLVCHPKSQYKHIWFLTSGAFLEIIAAAQLGWRSRCAPSLWSWGHSLANISNTRSCSSRTNLIFH